LKAGLNKKGKKNTSLRLLAQLFSRSSRLQKKRVYTKDTKDISKLALQKDTKDKKTQKT